MGDGAAIERGVLTASPAMWELAVRRLDRPLRFIADRCSEKFTIAEGHIDRPRIRRQS